MHEGENEREVFHFPMNYGVRLLCAVTIVGFSLCAICVRAVGVLEENIFLLTHSKHEPRRLMEPGLPRFGLHQNQFLTHVWKLKSNKRRCKSIGPRAQACEKLPQIC